MSSVLSLFYLICLLSVFPIHKFTCGAQESRIEPRDKSDASEKELQVYNAGKTKELQKLEGPFDIEVDFVIYDVLFEPVDCTICFSIHHACDDDPSSSLQDNDLKALPGPDMVITQTELEGPRQEAPYESEDYDAYNGQGYDLFVVGDHSPTDLDEYRPSNLEGSRTGLVVGDYLEKLDEDEGQPEEDLLEQTVERRVVQEYFTHTRSPFGECATLNYRGSRALHCFWHGNLCSFKYGLSASCRGLSVGQRCRCDFTPLIAKGRPVRPKLPPARQSPRKNAERRPRRKMQHVTFRGDGRVRRKFPTSPRGSRAPDPKSPQESMASNRVTRSMSKQASPETPEGPRGKYGEFPPELRALLLDYVSSANRPATSGAKSTTTGYSKRN